MSDQTYRIERCEHDIDKHYNAIAMGGHFVGRLEEHLPSCGGSRLVPVVDAALGGTDKPKEVCRHQFIPVFTLKNGSSYTECIECGRAYQYDY